MKMEKTMKVTIGDKTVVVSDHQKEEAIRNILIFGIENEKKVTLSKPSNEDRNSRRRALYKSRKIVRRRKIHWSSNETEMLRRLALRGASVLEMSALLKKEYHHVSNKLRGLGIQGKYKEAIKSRKDKSTNVPDESGIAEGETIKTDETESNNFLY